MVLHLWVDPDAEPGPVQVGFTVSKAVGNAATRNRVKRRLRHLTREHLPALEGLPGRAALVGPELRAAHVALLEELPGRAALVVRALPASAEASYAALGADLGRTLDRVSTP